MALGAGRGEVVGLVFRQATWLVATGLALGLAGAVVGGRLLRSSSFGVEPLNLALLSLACGTFVGVSVAAAYIPATRAASIDPMKALRSE
jgi:ABC-type antimicrobial peptide transport system permease subunit